MGQPKVHPTAEVDPRAQIGARSSIWHFAQVREYARIGSDCVIGKDSYVGENVTIGKRVKVQNGALIYSGASIENGVFVGPQVCITNDRQPRAVNPDGSLKGSADWEVSITRVRQGASLGACSVIVAGVTVGRWAMVGAGAVVVRDVPDHGLVMGVPATLVGHVCVCGWRLEEDPASGLRCPHCGSRYTTPPRVRQRRVAG